jgi:hypothetical protein
MRIAQLVGLGVLLGGMSAAGADPKPGETKPSETMTDRCSEEVAFPPSYDEKPTAKGTVILKRDKKKGDYSPWAEMTRKTGDDGRVRWWCHSTTGDWLDPGTWVVNLDPAGAVGCLLAVGGTVATDGAASPTVAACLKSIKIGSNAFDGWTAERSRCSDHSTKFRVRLGPDRLLQTECLGK